MREFKDDEGRPWRVALTVSAALRVREMVTVNIPETDSEGNPTGQQTQRPFDLIDIGTIAQTLQVIRSQYATVGEVLYAIVIAQVEERKLTRDQFLDGLRGDSLDAGVTVLEQELVDFFPLRLRRMVAALAAKMQEITGELLDQAEAGLASLTASAVSGARSGRPPESLESFPESGPCDNWSQPEMPASSMIGGIPQT
jgi:hypothetical protein